MTDLFEFAAKANGASLRDAALAQVLENSGDWRIAAKHAVESLPHDWEGTGQDLRVALIESGLPNPHHYNAWGALVRSCIPHLLQPTGSMRASVLSQCHAHRLAVYRRAA